MYTLSLNLLDHMAQMASQLVCGLDWLQGLVLPGFPLEMESLTKDSK